MVSGTVCCFLKVSGNSVGVQFHIRFLSARCAIPLAAACAVRSPLAAAIFWVGQRQRPTQIFVPETGTNGLRDDLLLPGSIWEFGRRPIPHTFSVRAVRSPFATVRAVRVPFAAAIFWVGQRQRPTQIFVPETGTNGLRDGLLLPESIWGIRHIAAQEIPQIIALLSIV